VGVFEPKIVSGLSSQDLVGTVYDFDDFNDDHISDPERSCPLNSKMIRKPDVFSSPVSGKSPKCKSGLQSLSITGLTRTRKSREPSTDSAGFDSENEISRRMSSNAMFHIEKSSPIRKRSVETETPILPPQVVPPMRLTIPRASSNALNVEANIISTTSTSVSYNRVVEDSPCLPDSKREFASVQEMKSSSTSMLSHCPVRDELPVPLASSSSPTTGIASVLNSHADSFPRATPMPGPSVKAMQDLEALNRAIESALATKPCLSDSVKPEAMVSVTAAVTAVTTASAGNSVMTSIDSSRHALKFKIKGPFLDANYSGNSAGNASNLPLSMNANSVTSTPAAESSNLRRMRKKELIRQYVSQDVPTPTQPSHLNAFLHFPYSSALAYANEEYLLAGSNDLSEVIGSTNIGTLPSSSNPGQQVTGGGYNGGKSHISIPKAVASLGSFGSHDDYVSTGPINETREGKRRRRGASMNPPLSRELRNLQMSASLVDPSLAADRTIETEVGKRKERRRGRPPSNRNNTSCLEMTLANEKDNNTNLDFGSHPPPKLKIRFREKLGAGEVVTVCDSGLEVSSDNHGNDLMAPRTKEEDEAKKIRFRPPKKRLSDSGCDMTRLAGGEGLNSGGSDPPRHENNPPTLEELWRQSMKFREEVMADFSKSERRKGHPTQSAEDNGNGDKPDGAPCGIDSKPEFKNKRHKTKTRKDRSKSKDRDGNNRRRPPVASTDLVSIAGGGGLDCFEFGGGNGDSGEGSRKRKRSLGGDESGLSPSTDGHIARNGVQIISKDNRENCSAPPKLIIRFGKKPVSSVGNRDPSSNDQKLPQPDGENAESQGNDVTPPPPLEKHEGDDVPSGVTSVRLMPIKLKLARCSQGSYVTKAKSDCTPPPSPTATPKESCEVR
jgi:hypothetical protein